MDSKQIVSALETLMEEAVELRNCVELPRIADGESETERRLQKARQALDRLEEIMRQAGRTKAMAARQAAAFTAVKDDAWAEALSKVRQSPSFRSDYIGPREKYAEADLSTLEQKRQARQADDLLSHVTEAYDFIRTCFFGLDGVRKDIKDILRSITSESRVERAVTGE